MNLLPYQLEIDKIPYPGDDLLGRKAVITNYLTELEKRMWQRFENEGNFTGDKENDKEESKRIVIELCKEMNNEWNNHRQTMPSAEWMQHNAFIQLTSIMFDFPIKLVPIMK